MGSAGTLLSPLLRSCKDLIPVVKLPHPSSLAVRAPRVGCVWRGSFPCLTGSQQAETAPAHAPVHSWVGGHALRVHSGKLSVCSSLQTPWVDCGHPC